jgi:hypothetical protein
MWPAPTPFAETVAVGDAGAATTDGAGVGVLVAIGVAVRVGVCVRTFTRVAVAVGSFGVNETLSKYSFD